MRKKAWWGCSVIPILITPHNFIAYAELNTIEVGSIPV